MGKKLRMVPDPLLLVKEVSNALYNLMADTQQCIRIFRAASVG